MRVLGIALAMVWATGCGETNSSTKQTTTTASGGGGKEVIDDEAHDPERHHAIERTFARKAIELQECWSDEYNKTKNRKWETNMNIQVMVPPSGTRSTVKVLQSSSPNATVEQCVEKAIAGWTFPEGPGTMPYSRTVHLGAQF